jgi:hypothetical protein
VPIKEEKVRAEGKIPGVPLTKTLFFDIPGKTDLRIRIPVGFPGPGWDKLSGEKCLDSRGYGGLWERGIPAVFWQSKRNLGVFSTGTEKGEFSTFSGIV